MTFPHDLPPTDEIVQLPVDRFAIELLRYISDPTNASWRSRQTIGLSGPWQERGVEAKDLHDVRRAAVEAWDWLEHHGLVARDPGDTGEHAYVTHRGNEVVDAEEDGLDGLALVRAHARIDVDLHPLIADRVRSQFLLGEHEAAAFIAMREVEIRVRTIGEFRDDQVGVDLMRLAFNPDKPGPLADPEQVPAERKATADLFAGAIGTFKNPSSHRQVSFEDPTVASEIVIFADLLLRLLDRVEADVRQRKIQQAATFAFEIAKDRITRKRGDGDTTGDTTPAA